MAVKTDDLESVRLVAETLQPFTVDAPRDLATRSIGI
jgi:hypothetical protein